MDLQAGTGHREMARQLLDQIDAAIESFQLTLSEDRAEQVRPDVCLCLGAYDAHKVGGLLEGFL